MVAYRDILDRLRVDPGQRTLGELLQEREHAAIEIARLRSEIERLNRQRVTKDISNATDRTASPASPIAQGTLVRLGVVCELIGVSRSTIYQWIAAGRFPAPVRIGARATRWRIEEIRAWQASL